MEGHPYDILILRAVYTAVDEAAALLMAGDTKKALVKLRQTLPAQYERSFEHKKAA